MIHLLQIVFLLVMVVGWIAARERERHYKEEVDRFRREAIDMRDVMTEARAIVAEGNEILNLVERTRPAIKKIHEFYEQLNRTY